MSPVQRRFRIGRAHGVRATALMLAGLLAGAGQTTQAAPAAPVDKEEAAAAKAAAKEKAAKALAAEAASKEPIPVIEGGRVTRQLTAEAARKEGLTVVNLSDDWLPYVFSQ